MNCSLVTLEEICSIGSGGTPSRGKPEFYLQGTIPWVKSGELRERVITRTEEYITETALKESAAKLLPAGALLVALYGATVGRLGILGIEAATNQAVCYLIPHKDAPIDAGYLYRALQTKVPAWLAARVGGAQPNINQGIIRKTKIPLPSLPEQRRIATILDKADAIRRKRRQAIDLMNDFLRSVFLEMFGDPVLNPKKWTSTPLETVADVASGVTKGRKLGDAQLVPVPYMRVANVQDGFIDLSEVKDIEVLSADIQRYALKSGDVLLTEGGDPDKLGRGAVWYDQIPNCIHQNHIFRVRALEKSNIDPEYLSALIGSEYGKRYFLRAAKQTTGIATINSRQLKAFPVLRPPSELQTKFNAVVRRARNLLQKIEDSAITIENLFNSTSNSLMSGAEASGQVIENCAEVRP